VCDIAGPIEQSAQDLNRLIAYTNPPAVLPQLIGPRVELERAEANPPVGERRVHVSAARPSYAHQPFGYEARA
jgi:hypothetical protein